VSGQFFPLEFTLFDGFSNRNTIFLAKYCTSTLGRTVELQFLGRYWDDGKGTTGKGRRENLKMAERSRLSIWPVMTLLFSNRIESNQVLLTRTIRRCRACLVIIEIRLSARSLMTCSAIYKTALINSISADTFFPFGFLVPSFVFRRWFFKFIDHKCIMEFPGLVGSEHYRVAWSNHKPLLFCFIFPRENLESQEFWILLWMQTNLRSFLYVQLIEFE
jgi:hypothetical protein